jgi:hypothetical protein
MHPQGSKRSRTVNQKDTKLSFELGRLVNPGNFYGLVKIRAGPVRGSGIFSTFDET